MTLRADDVVVRVGDAELLRGATLELRAGEVLAVVGPNGAGKSTLLRVLAGDRVPSAGSVTMEGRPLSAWSLSARALRRAVMGHDEEPAFPWLARELVLLGRLPRHGGAPSSRDHAIVARLLADVDAGALTERVHTTLSTGERQRIGLARALAQVWPDDLDPAEVAGATGADGTDRLAGSTSFAGSAGGDGGDGSTGFAEADGAAGAAGQTPGGPTRTPAWLLLDEPTSNLDLRHQAVALGLLRARAALGAGVLVVLHDINLAAAHADRIAIMHRGRIAASGSPAEVLRSDLLEQVFEVPMLVLPHPHLAHPLVIPDPTR